MDSSGSLEARLIRASVLLVKAAQGVRLGIERLEDGQKLRDIEHPEAARANVAELELAVSLVEGDVLGDDRAETPAVDVCNVCEIPQYLPSSYLNQPIDLVAA